MTTLYVVMEFDGEHGHKTHGFYPKFETAKKKAETVARHAKYHRIQVMRTVGEFSTKIVPQQINAPVWVEGSHNE